MSENRPFTTLSVHLGAWLLLALAACRGGSAERSTSEQTSRTAASAAPTSSAALPSSPAPSVAAEATFEVKGMHCATCPVTVRTAAKGVAGVIDARASTDEGRAWVTYDPKRTAPDVIAAAITEAGYPAKALAGAPGSQR